MRAVAAFLCLLGTACGSAATTVSDHSDTRIVSLDYCADQYVLKLADRGDIAAVSKDARQPYSFMRDAAVGLPQIRARQEDVIAVWPSTVVYAHGGSDVREFYERLGINVVQIPWAGDIEGVRVALVDVASQLGAEERARAVIAEFDDRLDAVRARPPVAAGSLLYLTPGGVTAGANTLVNALIEAGGRTNYEVRSGWHSIPLERLAEEQPDRVAASFYESFSAEPNPWSAARHTIVQSLMSKREPVALDGAWTACGGWFAINAIEALAAAETL